MVCKMNLVPGRGLPSRLSYAYAAFVEWCSKCGKSTNIRGFSKSGFKMGCLHSITVHYIIALIMYMGWVPIGMLSG